MNQINWVCFLNKSGYAQAAQDYIYALKNNGKEVRVELLHSAPEQMSMSGERYREVMSMIRVGKSDHTTNVFHCIPDMQRRSPKGTRNIGFATFETFDPPSHWVNILNDNDAVVCPSKFNIEIFEKAGIKKPLFYIPHCVDLSMYNDKVEGIKNERFTFLFFSTWKKRKGWEALLEAWMKEFDSSDNVRLLIKTDRYTAANTAIEAMKQNLGLVKKDIAPISFESRVLNEIELPRFFKSADCLICPTAGEGFGIPGMLCMALGVPIAITNFSGCTDYANEATATLIEPTKHIMYNDMDGIPQFRNHIWANVTPEEVASKMRYVFNNQSVIKDKAVIATDFVQKNFSYEVVAEKINKMLESVQ